MTASQTAGVAGQIRTDITDAIRYVAQHTGRSAQPGLGPSEIGHPCDRRIAYQSEATVPVTNPGDPLPSVLGTGGHLQMQHTMDTYEGQTPPAPGTYTPATVPELVAPYRDNPRYLTEHRVHAAPWLSGTTDLYDLWLDAVIDFKWISPAKLARMRRYGPPPKYRVQGHTYGLGWSRAGYTPKHIAVAHLPTATNLRYNVRCSLDYVWVWEEAYDPAIAETAIARVERIASEAAELDLGALPELWEVFDTDTSDCDQCPFYNPHTTHLGQGCPGA